MKKAFSLLEILVCIAIISMIATILYIKGISSGKHTSCMNNMHQIGLALSIYGSNNDNLAPPYVTQTKSQEEPERFILADATNWKNALLPYGNNAMFYCPYDSIKGINPTEFGLWNSTITSYTNNIHVFGKQDIYGANHTLYLPLDQGDTSSFKYLEDKTWNDNNSNMFSLHGKKINILYLDGHVKTMFWIR